MNELERVFRAKIVLIPDNKYRMMVTLMRSDRPVMWNFLCFNCGSKVCELNNSAPVGVSDFYDPQNVANSGVTRHCKGTLKNGLPCQYSYFFNLQ